MCHKMMFMVAWFASGNFNMTTQLLLLLSFLCATTWWSRVGSTGTPQELLRGFTATPNPSVSYFQPLLADSNANYSLGLLRVNRAQLTLALIHLPSSEQFWIANTTRLARWAGSTRIFFNGSLVISDPHSRVFWSSNTDGDRVWLSNTSNVQIQKVNEPHSVLWQSFDFPSDTLVENQNFTSDMTLDSSNGLYYMRLGSNFMGLYARFNHQLHSGQIYLRHKAMEVKAAVVEGQGPIYAVISSDGFLGMYQNGSAPVDIQSFNSFQQLSAGRRRLRLEPDGNLKGYYWTGSSWILDYQAISEPCELPSACGSYGLCHPGRGCSCLDNQTEYNSGRCDVHENNSGDFCSLHDSKYRVLRRSGVELPYKEQMGYQRMESLEECESSCEANCSCWGAVYSNSSGFCYRLNYPVQTLVGIGDDSKVGYFKVREGAEKNRLVVGIGVGVALLCGVLLVFCGGVGLWWCRFRKRRERGVSGAYVEEDRGMSVGPYKHLASASFRSIQLSER